MKMAKVNRIDILREIKKMEKKIPVIILAGSVDADRYIAELKDAGYDCNKDSLFIKPVDLYRLFDKIRKNQKNR